MSCWLALVFVNLLNPELPKVALDRMAPGLGRLGPAN